MEWYVRALRKYATFGGRASRREFWMFTLWHTVFVLAAIVLDGLLDIANIDATGAGLTGLMVGPITVIYLAAIIVPNIAVQCRRLHDSGKTGWVQIVGIVPFVGAIVLIVLCALPGTPAPNRYGPVPSPDDARAG